MAGELAPLACRVCRAGKYCQMCHKSNECGSSCSTPKSCLQEIPTIELLSRGSMLRVALTQDERDLYRLISIPADDVNFKSALERASIETIQTTLAGIAGHAGNKTKEKAPWRQLKKLESNTDGRKNMGKAEVQAAEDLYQLGLKKSEQDMTALREQVEDIRQESFAQGTIRALESVTAFNELMKFVTLYRIKQHKEYRQGGLTWDGFCNSLGLERRNVDRILEDISPLVSEFSDKVHMISNIPFNKIRHLGRQISGQLSEMKDGMLTYGDETIPIIPENADDIQALIERIDEEAKKAKEEIADQAAVLKNKEEQINKLDKKLAKLTREAEKRGYTQAEEEFLRRMETTRTTLDGFLLDFDPERNPLPDDASPRMRAAYMETIGYIKRAVDASYDTAADFYGDAELDHSGWIPPNMRDSEAEIEAQREEQKVRHIKTPKP